MELDADGMLGTIKKKGHLKMSKSKETTREQKAPKTIKVTTVVKAVVVTIAIVAAFISGYFYKVADDSRVIKQAVQLNSQLSKTEAK